MVECVTCIADTFVWGEVNQCGLIGDTRRMIHASYSLTEDGRVVRRTTCIRSVYLQYFLFLQYKWFLVLTNTSPMWWVTWKTRYLAAAYMYIGNKSIVEYRVCIFLVLVGFLWIVHIAYHKHSGEIITYNTLIWRMLFNKSIRHIFHDDVCNNLSSL